MLEKEVEEKIFLVLRKMSLETFVRDIKLVYGDLSPRRYFRVFLDTGAPISTDTSSVIIMYFDSLNPPEAESRVVKSSFDSYLEAGEFFGQHGIPVPLVYFSSAEERIIVLEDLGSSPIIDLARAGEQSVSETYRMAVRGIHALQEIERSGDFFIFERGFDSRVYIKEMMEFSDYFLPETVSDTEKKIITDSYRLIGQQLESFPRVLVHRDYHSWNLMKDTKGRLRIIDFQDALMGTRSYDLVALVHERDIDSVLGNSLVSELEEEFFSYYQDSRVRDLEYPFVLLQRDLKVAGRFAKVVRERGLKQYGVWIPGTISRISDTLEKNFDGNSQLRDFFKCIKPFLVREYVVDKGLL
jgi:aminoglycoside/choline kinase family phosphotransferase